MIWLHTKSLYYEAGDLEKNPQISLLKITYPEILVVLYIHRHVYKTYNGLYLLQLQTVNSRAGNKYTYMKSKSKNITTSTNASGDLLNTQATTTIMSTNLFPTSMPMLLSAIMCECGDTTWSVCPYRLSIYMEWWDTTHTVISIWIQIWILDRRINHLKSPFLHIISHIECGDIIAHFQQ